MMNTQLKNSNGTIGIQVLFFSIIFIIGADTFLVSPLLPFMRETFNVSMGTMGLLVTAYAIFYATFAFGFGPLSDHIGRRKMIIGGMLSFTFCTLMCGMVNHFWILIFFRALSGIAAAATAPQIWASIGDLIPKEKRGRAMGITISALSVSQILGVPAAAFIASMKNWHTPFLALALFSGIVLLGGIVIYPSQKTTVGAFSYSGLMSSLKRVFSHHSTVAGLFITFFFMMASFGSYTFLGAWLVQTFGLKVNQVGYVIIIVGIGNFFGNLIAGYLADKIDKKPILIGSLIVLAITLLLVPFTSFSLYAAIVCIFVWLVSGGASLTTVNAILSEMIPTLRGTVMSLNSSFMYLGTTLGAALDGLILKKGGYVGIGFFGSIAAIVALCCFGILIKLVKTNNQEI